MEQDMVMVTEHFDTAVILYTFLGIVAIIMSVSGLYSLVSLNLQNRTKELGIRKILGAPVPHIILHASKLFLIIMIISFAAGSLLGTVMVNAMMNSIWEYYEAIDVKVLSLAISILFTIAVTTILLKIVRITFSNPVEALRYE
jgi:ABC-type antimicrobial peptide transport system permease subunit